MLLQPGANRVDGMIQPGFQPGGAQLPPRLQPPPTTALKKSNLGGVGVFTGQPTVTPIVNSQQSMGLQPLARPQANTMASIVPQQPAVAVPPPNIRNTGSASVLAALDTLTVSLDKIQPGDTYPVFVVVTVVYVVFVGPHQPTVAYDKNGIRVLIYTAKVKLSHMY